MWSKRAFSLLLSCILVFTALPLSSSIVYAQDKMGTEVLAEDTLEEEAEQEDAGGTLAGDVEEDPVDSVQEGGGQTDPEGSGISEDDAQAGESAQGEDGVQAGDGSQAGDGAQVSDGPQAGQDDGQILEDEDSRGAEEEAESGRDGAEDSQGAGDEVPADGAGSTSEDGVIEDTDTSDAGQEGEAPREGAAPREVTSQEEALEEESENAMADGETVEYHIGVSSVDGKMIAFPGQEITLAADACRIDGADIAREGFLYKWEIVDGNDDGMISFKNGIEGQIGDYPTATLAFSGEPNAQVCDQDPDAFHYTIKVRATLYDGEENGAPIERTSGEIEGIQLRDEYFEITPLEMEQIRLGEEVELPLSILYYSYYFANENGGMRYGYNVSWAFEYDENVLRVTDKDGNRIDPSGQAGGSWLSAVEDGGTNEIRVKIRRVSAGFSDFRATARFSYRDHNGTVHGQDGLDQDTFGVNYAQWNLTDGDELTWFRDDYKTVYTDAEEAPSLVLNTDRLGDDWQDNLEIDVAVSAIEDGVDQPLEEDEQYTVSDDGTCVTLSLAYLNSVTADIDVWVHARTYIKGLDHNDENKVSGAAACFHVRRTEENYENSLEGDCEMLPGWDWNIEKRKRVYVRNTAHPDGNDEFFEVTGIRSSDEDVVETYVSEDENDEWPFHYRAKAHGGATVTISYKDLHNENKEHSFEVYVKEDVYGVSVFTEDGSDRALPGKSIHLKTSAWHHSEVEDQQGVTDGLTYVWNLKKVDGNPDPDQFASLQPSEDGLSAEVTFRRIAGEDDGFWHEVDAEVLIYNGTYSEENPEENKVGYDCIRLVMADQYIELWPAAINSRMEVGDTEEVEAQLRFYPGTGENGFDLADDVHYYWYYENWKVRVHDANDKQVGNEDDEGHYQDSEASTGSSCHFSIYRRRQADAEITLKACWKDGAGNDHWEERRFRLEEKDYRVSLDDRGDNRVFSDGDKTIDVRVEGIPENAVYGTDYQISDIAVGLWSDSEDGDGRQITEPYPDTVYTFDPGNGGSGMALTLHGSELAKQGLTDERQFGLSMLLSYKGESLWIEESDMRFMEAGADYHDREWDREMLPGWDGEINQTYDVNIRNADHPDGEGQRYYVRNVEIKSQEPAEEGKEVLSLEKCFENDDPQSDNFWWRYETKNHGTAVLHVTCQDVLNPEKDWSYDFSVYVKQDVYGVDARTQDGARYMRVLPGETVGVSVMDVSHDSDDDDRNGDISGLVYRWAIEDCRGDGNPESPPVNTFAEISQGQDPRTALVTFRALKPGESDVWYDLDAVVYVYREEDQENPVATDSLRLTMADSYLYIEPAVIRGNLVVGQDYPVTAKLLSYSVNGGADPVLLGDGEGNGSVHYFWYYDSDAVQVLDEDNNQVGNEDENGNYKDSEKSTGPVRGFIIRPLKNQDTDISLEACWTDENGEEHWGERRDYHLIRKNYDIWFDEHDVSVYTDAYSASGGPRTLSLNTENPASLGDDWEQEISLDLHVGHWDGEKEEWGDTLTEGTDYTLEKDGGQFRFALTQSFLAAMDQAYQAQTGPDYDEVRLVARIYPKNLPDEEKTEENCLADTDAWFHVRAAREEYDREWDRIMLPGWNGTVRGSYNCHVENSQHEDGEDSSYMVTKVEVLDDRPLNGEGGNVVGDLSRCQNNKDESDYWWDYRVDHRGEADLKVTYNDIHGAEKTYVFTLFVGNDVYEVYMDSTGREYNGLPGTEIELSADAVHKYLDENGEYKEDRENLGCRWSFEYGDKYAEITVHEDDPSRATLRFNDLPQGKDWIDEEIRVGVRILNKEGDDTEGYDARNFWVRSDYTEIWPLMFDPCQDVGVSIKDQKLEVRRYRLGQEKYEIIDPEKIRYEWHYDENVLTVTENKGGNPVQVRDGDTALGDTFTLTRKEDWNHDYSVRAYWINENGDEENIWADYQLWEIHYDYEFLTGGQPVGDDEKLRDDEEKTYALDVQNLGGFGGDIFYVVDYRAADSKEQAGDLLNGLEEGRDYFINDDEGGAVYVNMIEGVDYKIDYEKNTVTLIGDLIERKTRRSVCGDPQFKQEFYMGALLFCQGKNIESRWNRILLERTGKDTQNIRAADVLLTMFDQPAISVEGAAGGLTYESSDESIVRVSEDGKLIPVAEGSAVIGVKATATDDYRPGRTSFTVTVRKLSLADPKVTLTVQVPAGGYTYDGKEKTPEAALTYGGKALTRGTDYSISYSANKDAGTARVTAKGTGNCEGTVTKDFTISKASQNIAASDISLTYGDSGSIRVTGNQGALSFTSLDTKVAVVDASGKVTAEGAGTAKIRITAGEKGNYKTTTKEITVTVTKKAQSISVPDLSLTYPNGGSIKVTGNQGTLSFTSLNTKVAAVDASGKVTAKGAGTAKIRITAAETPNFTSVSKEITVTVARGKQSVTLKSSAASVAAGKSVSVTAAGAKGKLTYSSSKKAVATVTSKGKVTAIKVGTVKITVKAAATANYEEASAAVTIKVVPGATASITAVNQAKGIKLSWEKVAGATGFLIYRGKEKIATIGKGSTTTFTDKKITSKNNGGKFTYKIIAKASTGNSTLSKSLTTYFVLPSVLKSAKSTAAGKAIVSWEKNKAADGYEIQYTLKKNLTGGKIAPAKKANSSIMLKNLSSGKQYYVRVRAYIQKGKTKYYSAWSGAGKVKIK